jgi:hypothetical protein
MARINEFFGSYFIQAFLIPFDNSIFISILNFVPANILVKDSIKTMKWENNTNSSSLLFVWLGELKNITTQFPHHIAPADKSSLLLLKRSRPDLIG